MRKTVLVISIFGILCGTVSAGEVEDFIASDANKDRLLQKPEFQAFIKRRAKAGNKSAKFVVTLGAWGRALSAVDTNSDQIVTPAELRAFDAKD